MPPETNPNTETNPAAETETRTPLQIIQDLRENTVPRAEHERLAQEYNQLLAAYANGERSSEEDAEEPPIALETLRQNINNPDIDNLSYVENVLQLRRRLMEEGYPDPFLPSGSRVKITAQDREIAQNVADCLETCVELSDGDSSLFTTHLQNYLIDTSPYMGVNKPTRRK